MKVNPKYMRPDVLIHRTHQHGGMNIFKGHRRQRGGIIGFNFLRNVVPRLVGRVVPKLIKKAGTKIVKEAISEGRKAYASKKKGRKKAAVKAGIVSGAKNLAKAAREQLLEELGSRSKRQWITFNGKETTGSDKKEEEEETLRKKKNPADKKDGILHICTCSKL